MHTPCLSNTMPIFSPNDLKILGTHYTVMYWNSKVQRYVGTRTSRDGVYLLSGYTFSDSSFTAHFESARASGDGVFETTDKNGKVFKVYFN